MSKEAAMAIATGQTNTTIQGVLPATTGIEVKTSGGEQQVPATPAPSADDRIQQLIKKEVRLVKEQEQFKKDRASLEEKVKKAEALLERDRQFDELRKTDNIAALKMLGYTDNDIFNSLAAAAPKDKTPEQIAREAALEEIKKADDKRAEEAKALEEQNNEKLITNFKGKIAKTIESNPDKYEFCNFNGPFAEELIYETVAQVLKTEKKFISVDEAALLVESYYEENAKAMDGLKKRKPAEVVVEKKPVETKVQVKPKTLTNEVRPTAAATAKKSESSSEKRARLEKALAMGVHPDQLR